jgi:hypothetical protein
MSTPGLFVPGIFSQAGRETAFEIENLQSQLKLSEGENSTAHGEEAKPKASATSPSKAHVKGSGAAKGQEDAKPRTPGGELAKAIQEKLNTKKAEDVKKHADPNASKSPVQETKEHLTTPFHGEGKDGNWASKFTASYDVGAINHRNEQHPSPAWYQIKHDSVLVRPPAWDVKLRAAHKPLEKPVDDPANAPLAFMTGLDVKDDDAVQSLTAQQRALMRKTLGTSLVEKPKPAGTAMGLNTGMGPLSKVGRTHIHAHEVSCAGETDLLEQDIKGYPKLRYPEWDMNASEARKPLLKGDDLGEPGKYDYSLDCIKPRNHAIGIGFGKALPRSQDVRMMGYSAPPAVLHPEEKRTRGLLPDRSCAKNAVRHRVTHVNDFDRELARPPLLTGAATVFHDESDPSACHAVYQRQMSYDATTADIYVTHRRDICPKYGRMLGRGRDAVQGLRALSHDLAVRGSVGLGFVETKSMVEHSVEQREGRRVDGRKQNPHIGPRFDHRTQHVHTAITEKLRRGAPLVAGTGHNVKHSPLKQKDNPILANAFKRSASLPGFDARTKHGGVRVLAKSRSSTAIPGWSPSELEGDDE